jgi:hypothetical protein
MPDLAREMQTRIQQVTDARLLVSAALLEKLVFDSGFEIADIVPSSPGWTDRT